MSPKGFTIFLRVLSGTQASPFGATTGTTARVELTGNVLDTQDPAWKASELWEVSFFLLLPMGIRCLFLQTGGRPKLPVLPKSVMIVKMTFDTAESCLVLDY